MRGQGLTFAVEGVEFVVRTDADIAAALAAYDGAMNALGRSAPVEATVGIVFDLLEAVLEPQSYDAFAALVAGRPDAQHLTLETLLGFRALLGDQVDQCAIEAPEPIEVTVAGLRLAVVPYADPETFARLHECLSFLERQPWRAITAIWDFLRDTLGPSSYDTLCAQALVQRDAKLVGDALTAICLALSSRLPYSDRPAAWGLPPHRTDG